MYNQKNVQFLYGVPMYHSTKGWMMPQNTPNQTSVKLQKECQQALFVMFGFMFLFQGLAAEGMVFVATISMGVGLLSFGLFTFVRDSRGSLEKLNAGVRSK